MSARQKHASLLATAAEYARVGMHDRARELQAEAAKLEPEAEAERRATRAGVSHLAALGDAAQAAADAPKGAFVEEEISAERRASRAALSPLMAAADALRDKQIRERSGGR